MSQNVDYDMEVIKYHHNDLDDKSRQAVEHLKNSSPENSRTFHFYKKIIHALAGIGSYYQHDMIRVWKDKIRSIK